MRNINGEVEKPKTLSGNNRWIWLCKGQSYVMGYGEEGGIKEFKYE